MINKIKENIKKLEKELKSNKRKLISSILMVFFLIIMLLTGGNSIIFRFFMTIVLLVYIVGAFYFSKTIFDISGELSHNKEILYEYELNEMKKRYYNYYNSYREFFTRDSTYGHNYYGDSYRKVNKPIIDQNVKNSYQLMGLDINDNIVKIKNRYRELVKKWHPDVFSNDTKENQEISKRNMQKLNNAYNIIKKHKGIK